MSWKYLNFLGEGEQAFAAFSDQWIRTTLKVGAADASGKQGIAGEQKLTLLMIKAESSGGMPRSCQYAQVAVLQKLSIMQIGGGSGKVAQLCFIPVPKALVETDLFEVVVSLWTQIGRILFADQYFQLGPVFFQTSER